MEQVRIFATPDAFKQLTQSNNQEAAKDILTKLHDQISNKTERSIDSYVSLTSFGISARWADDPSKTSVVLIYYSQDMLGLRHFNFPETFWEDISKAIPFEFA